MVKTARAHEFVKGVRKRFCIGVNSSRIPRKKESCVVNDDIFSTTDSVDGQEHDDIFLNLLLPPLGAIGQEQESDDIVDNLLEIDAADATNQMTGIVVNGQECDDDFLLVALEGVFDVPSAVVADGGDCDDFVEKLVELDAADAYLQAVVNAKDKSPSVVAGSYKSPSANDFVDKFLALDAADVETFQVVVNAVEKSQSDVTVSEKSSSVEVDVNAIPLVEADDVPSCSKGLLHSIAYVLKFFHGGRKCEQSGCCQLGRLKGRKQLSLCRFHDKSLGNTTAPKEVLKTNHESYNASKITLQQVEKLQAVVELRNGFVEKDTILFERFKKAVISVEELLGLRLPLVCNAGSMIEAARHVITPCDVHHLVLAPVVVHFVIQAIDLGMYASVVYYEVLAKLKANVFCQQVAFEVKLSSEVMSRLPAKNVALKAKVKRKFSLVVWCSRFLLDCINCAEVYNIVDALINVCKVTVKRRDEDIIQVMASLGFQMNLLARLAANHARDCSITQSKDLIVLSNDRTQVSKLARCILMPLYNDLLAVLFAFGFFPGVSSFSDEVRRHSSEFCKLLDGSLCIGQLHAYVKQYIGGMLHNMGLSNSNENIDEFTEIVMDGNERVFTLPLFVAAYLAFTCKCVVNRCNEYGPLKNMLVKHTSSSSKIQLVVGCNAKPFYPKSYLPFAIWHNRFETRMLKIAQQFFELSSWCKSIAVDVGMSGGSECDIKIFCFNVTSNLDICYGGIDPVKRLEVLTSIVSNICNNSYAHTAYCPPVVMNLIQAFDIVAGSSINADENNELEFAELENEVSRIVLLLNDKLRCVGRRSRTGVKRSRSSLNLSEG